MENQQPQNADEARKRWLHKKQKSQVQQQMINEQMFLNRMQQTDESLYKVVESVMATKGIAGLNQLSRLCQSFIHHINAGKDLI